MSIDILGFGPNDDEESEYGASRIPDERGTPDDRGSPDDR